MNTESMTFKLAVSNVDTPISGDTPAGTEKQSSGTPSGSGGFSAKPTGSNSPNTGFLTQDGGRDVLGVVTSPVVSGAFIFAGIILLLALVAKMKKNKNSSFKNGLSRKRYTTRILGFATVLMFAAGLGGTVSRFMGVAATDESRIVNASLVEATDDYKLYCGTDRITIDSATAADGYQIAMYVNDEDGILRSNSDGITNIASSDDWSGIGVGQWGYYVGEYSASATENPIPLNIGVIDNKTEATAGSVPVTYCAKVSSNISEADFSAEVGYIITSGIGSDVDYNSSADTDGDGIANRIENRNGMNPVSTDSDGDGLYDYAELYTYGTSPISIDTDSDGLYDYSEIALETNPLAEKSNGVDIDSERTFTYSETIDDDLSFTVTGRGNIPLSTVDVVEPSSVPELFRSDDMDAATQQKLDNFAELPGKVYLFTGEGDIDSATITASTVAAATVEAEDDDVLGVPVSSSSVLYGASLTFNDDDEAHITDISEALDDTTQAGKITFSISSSDSAIVLVGDAAQMNNGLGEDELGAPIVTPDVAIAVAVLIEALKVVAQKVDEAGGLPAFLAKVTSVILSMFTTAKQKTPTKLQARRMTSQQKTDKKEAFKKFILDEAVLWSQIIAGFLQPCNEAAEAAGYSADDYTIPCVPYFAKFIVEDLTQFFKALSGIDYGSGETVQIEREVERKLDSGIKKNTKKNTLKKK